MRRMTNKELVLRAAMAHYGYTDFFSYQIEQLLSPQYVKKTSISPAMSQLKKEGYLTSYSMGFTENGHKQYMWRLTEKACDFPWTNMN